MAWSQSKLASMKRRKTTTALNIDTQSYIECTKSREQNKKSILSFFLLGIHIHCSSHRQIHINLFFFCFLRQETKDRLKKKRDT